jgi:hypothetical protein
MRGVVFGDDEASRGVFVESMNEARPPLAPYPGDLGAMMEEGMN